MTLHIKPTLLIFTLTLMPSLASAQYAWQEEEREASKPHFGSDITYTLEAQGSASKGKTPLWLNANKHGLSSLEEANGYMRASIQRSVGADSIRRWAVGYGADIVVPAELHQPLHRTAGLR